MSVEDKDKIESNAENCNKTASAFLRLLGLGFAPKSVLDIKAALELSKVNGDQARLGNLLNQLLSDQRVVLTKDYRDRVKALVVSIEEVQQELREMITEVRAKR